MAGYEDFVNLNYKPTDNDLICSFYMEPAKGVSSKVAAGAIAGESSTGTWTEVRTLTKQLKEMSAVVFEIKGNWIKVAYPSQLFEAGSMPQIYSSVAGNIFGMKVLNNLRLYDIKWPKGILKSFRGPEVGIDGIRKRMKVYGRPLCGTIIKPKPGLPPKLQAKAAYEAWSGGLDIAKEDEPLTSQKWSRFDQRMKEVFKVKEKAERETGERKIYFANVTGEARTMEKRARLVHDLGGDWVMVDILTAGWSGLQTLRETCHDLGLAIHAHRAMHAALDRNPRHGISMLVLAETARIIGVDSIHIGTYVGKMSDKKKEVTLIGEEIEDNFVKPEGHALGQNWHHLKRTFAVCSGGLHAGLIDALVNFLGRDLVVQAGGGVWGHKNGNIAGARSMRQSVDAIKSGMPASEYARNHKELASALKQWGYLRPK